MAKESSAPSRCWWSTCELGGCLGLGGFRAAGVWAWLKKTARHLAAGGRLMSWVVVAQRGWLLPRLQLPAARPRGSPHGICPPPVRASTEPLPGTAMPPLPSCSNDTCSAADSIVLLTAIASLLPSNPSLLLAATTRARPPTRLACSCTPPSRQLWHRCAPPNAGGADAL